MEIARPELWRAAQQAAEAGNTRACVCALISSQIIKVRKKVPKRIAELYAIYNRKVSSHPIRLIGELACVATKAFRHALQAGVSA
jgi:hypothetical protein